MAQDAYQCQDTKCTNKDKNENCLYRGQDGEVVQCVNSWAEKKYYYLDRYLTATKPARGKFSSKGNSVYLDLFAGPGLCRIKKTKQEISGGAMRVLHIEEPFNRVIMNDFVDDNIYALKKRTSPSVEIHSGDTNVFIDTLVPDLLKSNFKYHFAYLDPFAPTNLKFSVIKQLAKLDRLDIIINFPLGPIRRNYKQWMNSSSTVLDDFLGTTSWRQKLKNVSDHLFPKIIIDIYLEQFLSLGFPSQGLNLIDENEVLYQGSNMPTVKNSKSVTLYYLFFASKHPLAANIWKSIIKFDPTGQQNMF